MLAVFVSGIVVGVFGHRVYAVKSVTATLSQKPPTPEQWREQYISEMTARLKLDAGQVHQINLILDDTRAKMEALKEKGKPERKAIYEGQVAQVENLLRDDQKREYRVFREERRRRMKEREKREAAARN